VKAKRTRKRSSPRAAGAQALRRRLRNTERRLRQVEQRYEIAMGAINESVYDWDIDGGRILYSESMQRAIGLPPGMLKTTRDWWDRIHPEDLARYRAAFIAHFKGSTGRFECEYRYRAADGAWRWCRQHGLALRDSRGRAVRMIGSTGDITQLKEREKELVAQKALTQAIIEQIPGAVFMKDREGRFTLANRGWSAMSGIPAERAIGRTVHDLYPAENAKRFAAEDEKLLAQGAGAPPVEAVHEGPRQGQFRIVRKALLSGPDGSVQGLVCTSTDITEIKRAESELANQAKFTNDVFDSLPLALAMRDGDGRYLFVNRTWEKNFGARREDVVGNTVHQRLTKAEADEVLALDRAALGRGPGAPLELSEFSLRGRHYLQTRTVMVDSQGAVRGVLAASLDVTEKHQVEQALAQERERLGDQIALTRSLIDENPSAMYLKDLQGRYVTVNDAWLKMVGVTRERAIGRNVLELFPEKESERYHAEDMRLLSVGEGSSEVESLRTGPDGRPQWVIIRKAVLRRADGDVVGLIGANTDITRLKQYEAQLADRAKFITDLVDALPVSIALRDTECRFLRVNRAWERYFNLRREDVLGKRFIELPGWKENAELAQVAKDAEQVDRDVIARGPGGEPLHMEVQRLGRTYLNSRQVFTDTAGRTVGVLATGLDTTERHAMEEALATEQRRLDMVVTAARVGIVDWEGSTHRTFYSPRLREILGHAPDSDTSQWPDYFKVLIHPDDRERVTGRWQAFIRGKGPEGPRGEYYSPEEYRLLRADGSHVWVQASGIAVRDERARVTRWIAAITDITERRAQEEELRQSVRLREEVERMSRHDLKTPLNSVIAMSRLLREGGRVPPEDVELLGTIERAGYRILNMVNLSLDLFRMETGTYQFHPQAVDLVEVACRVAADLESQAASKSLDVRVRANGVSAATQEVLARGDELLCYSMFANLVKNAIEASPPGGTVSISLKREDDSVVAEVHNPGTVPEGIRGRFFRKYATTGKSAGLGLGTYSAQLMARVQEGDLSLESSDAAGTTLIARLLPAGADLARAVESRAQASASVAAGEALPPRKVLVVDDDEFNRLVLRRYLPSPPLSVAFAVNGRAALEAAGQDWPDVVLLDLEMPVMDGYEAAHRLREMERARNLKRCLIVAISSNDEEPVVQRALAAGCDQYVVKPAPRQALWRILGGAAGDEPAAPAPIPASASDAVIVDEDLRAKLPEFLRSRRELLEQMLAALAAGDRPLFKRSAHRLAGSFALFGFAWAAARCREIESDALDGYPNDLETRVAAVRAHLAGVAIEFAPAKAAVSEEKL
jgi:PAS domain S-box-containing protein